MNATVAGRSDDVQAALTSVTSLEPGMVGPVRSAMDVAPVRNDLRQNTSFASRDVARTAMDWGHVKYLQRLASRHDVAYCGGFFVSRG